MRYTFLLTMLAAISVLVYNCSPSGDPKTIRIKNTLSQDREELVRLDYDEFTGAFSDTEFRLINQESGEEVAYQLETSGEDFPKYVLIEANVAADDELILTVKSGEPTKPATRTYARYIPERFDDFAWENDRVAFRMYGKALEGRADDADGVDIWVKRTNNLVIDNWYKGEDYHKDHGEGLDYYSVGHTLGAGDVAPYVNDTLYMSKHYRTHDVLDNGPLRSTFRLGYEAWDVKGQPVSVSKTISLDAGSLFNRVELLYEFSGGDKLTIASGIARRGSDGDLKDETGDGMLTYWEPPHGDDGTTGVAVLVEDRFDAFKKQEQQFLALFRVESGVPFVYYNGGAWDREGRIKNAEEWNNYVKQYRERVKSPLRISLE